MRMPLGFFLGQGDDSIVVQYEMHAVEDLGLLKMDFLGLSNLTIIEQALEIIENVSLAKTAVMKWFEVTFVNV